MTASSPAKAGDPVITRPRRDYWMPRLRGHDSRENTGRTPCPTTFLKNPLSLFDVKGKTAIVTGASGAFGALAAKTLAGAGANVVLAAEQGRRAEEGRRRMRDARRQGRGRSRCGRARKKTATKIVKAAVDTLRPRRHPGGRLRPQQGGEDRRPEARGFPRRDGRQRHAVLADGARRRQADAQAGRAAAR